MKKIFEKPYNLLFAISAVIFLQFLSALVCFYFESVAYINLGDWGSYIYMAYCLTVCAVSAALIIKKTDPDINAIKMWLAGFFLYAFSEIIFFIKIIYEAFSGGGFSLVSESIYNLWDNQHLYRLHLCAAVIFMIYCVMFILEKKKLYISFACGNLLVFFLCMFFMPGGENLLIFADAGLFEVAGIEIIRESGIIIFMLNIFIFALYKYYNYKEN